jgi:hypothetical protein
MSATKPLARDERKLDLLERGEYLPDDTAHFAIWAGEFKPLASKELPNDASDSMPS